MNSLNEQTFRLSPALESIDLPAGVRLLKQRARGEYLALTPEQQRVLARFDGRRTVQEILHELLTGQQPVRLRAFYDLVLNARDKGFLFAGETESAAPERELRGRRWGVRCNAATILGLSLAALLAGAVAFARLPVPAVETAAGLLGVLALTALGLSLANLLAGCALSGLGREIYRPRVRWDRGLPFFSVDVRDAFMAGRRGETCVALATLAGPFLLALVAGVTGSGAVLLGAWATLLILASPFGSTPAHHLVHAWLRKEYELPRCAEQFLSTRMVGQLLRWREPLHEERYFIGYSTYAILWLGLVYRLGARLLEAEGDALVNLLLRSADPAGRLASLVIFSGLALLAAAPLAYALWVLGRAGWRGIVPVLFNAEAAMHRSGAAAERPQPAEVERFLGGTLLFSQLPPGELHAVAAAMRFVRATAGTCIIRERDVGRSLFVVRTGTVAVLKENEAGQNVRVATLGPGEAFGEIALLDRVRRTSTVRSLEDTTLFALDKPDFERLLLSSLGAKTVRDTVQICAFLRRNPLFAEWPSQPLLELSGAFAVEPFAAGAVVLREQQPNDSFYLVKEGRFAVRAHGQPLATLGPGDFFGEISLLRGQPTIAEVACVGGGVCLRLERADFLTLLSQGLVTGLVIERTGDARAAREGRP